MVKVGIAVGVGVGAFLLVCCLCWGASKLRQSFKTGRIGATLEEILVESRKGVKKDVVRTFPIVETSELNFETNTKLQCPICWLQFRDTDTVRQLPHCDHIFHRHCINPVLENQITCPVCGTILSDSPKKSEQILSGKHKKSNLAQPFQEQIPLRSLYSINRASSGEESLPSPTKICANSAESAPPPPPSWVLVNRPMPLPHTENVERSGSSDRFEIELNPSHSYGGSGKSPLLSKYLSGVEEWHSDDIEIDQNCIDISFTFGTEVPVEKRKPGIPYEKCADSFTFTTRPPPTMPPPLQPSDAFRSRSSRGNESYSFSSSSDASTRFSRTTSRSSQSTSSSSDSRFDKFDRWDHDALPHLEDVAEAGGMGDHLPLTMPPDQCSFDRLPVVTSTDEVHRKRLRN